MSIHDDPHPLAGQTVHLGTRVTGPGLKPGAEFEVEDYWDRISGQSWGVSRYNPAALNYAMRTAVLDVNGHPVPDDDEVLYGKVGGLGHLVHVSELGAVVGAQGLRDVS